MKKNKLYVLIDKELSPVYGCVQGGHAVAQWMMEHPYDDWKNSYLIYLSADVDKWNDRLDMLGVDYSRFSEPDLDDRITALAIHGHDRLFKSLKTIT